MRGVPWFNPITVALAARRDWLTAMRLLAGAGAPVSRSRFGLPLVAVHSAAAARQVLVEDAESYGRPWIVKNIMSDALGPMLFTSEGDQWLSKRQAVGPAFAHATLDRVAQVIAETVSDELDGWRDGDQEDVQDDLTRLTMRIGCRALLGVDPATDPIGRAIDRHFGVVLDWITYRFRHLSAPPARIPTRRNRALVEARRSLEEAVRALIERRRATGSTSDDILGVLMSQAGRSDDEIVHEAVGYLFAGHETTASTLTWALYELALHPELQQPIADEGTSLDSGQPGLAASVNAMTHTGRAVNETLRLYPAGVGIARVARARTSIDGTPVRRGTTVLIGVYSMQRASTWSAPDEFRPDRDFPEPTGSGDDRAFLPFGWGPRRCLGARFAVIEMRLVLAATCARWIISYPGTHPPRPAVIPSLRVDGALPMRLEPRE